MFPMASFAARRPTGLSLCRPTFDRDLTQTSPHELPAIDIHSRGGPARSAMLAPVGASKMASAGDFGEPVGIIGATASF